MSSKLFALAIIIAVALPYGVSAQSMRTSSPGRRPTRTKSVPARAARPVKAASHVRSASTVIEEPVPEGAIIEESFTEQPLVDVIPNDCCHGNACGKHFWVRGEYLLWWTNGATAPALATSSPGGTAQASAGVLGQAGTTTLFGGENLDSSARSGGRISIGGWADAQQSHGFEVNYLMLGEDSEAFSGGSDLGILARPFFNAQTGAQDSRLIVFPGLVTGSLNIEASTEFQSLEVLFRGCLSENPCGRTDYLFGYRFADLTDRVRIDETTLSLSGVTAGTRINLYDQFDTRNTFHGIELGLASQQQFCPCWSLELVAKVAIGSTNSHGRVAGQRTTVNTLGSSETEGGLLALGTNLGDHGQNQFSVLPEFGAKLHFDINPRWKASVGYSIICWTDVIRAPEQIDSSINPTQIPPSVLTGDSRPLFPFTSSDFVAQGVTFGLECSF